MSLEPEWYSTIYRIDFCRSWTLSALAFAIAVMAMLSIASRWLTCVAPLHFHDLGKLLLALVMLWAYFAFSQFLIIWSGNLPEEIDWYLPRTHGGWGVIAIVVVILHFAFPFFVSVVAIVESATRTSWSSVAVLILVMRVIDLIWVIAPAFSSRSISH